MLEKEKRCQDVKSEDVLVNSGYPVLVPCAPPTQKYIVCDMCGHKNPEHTAMCEMCSNYLSK